MDSTECTECSVCMENPCSPISYFICEHTSVCDDCFKELGKYCPQKCPQCTKKVKDEYKVTPTIKKDTDDTDTITIQSIANTIGVHREDCVFCATCIITGKYITHTESRIFNRSIIFYLLRNYPIESVLFAFSDLKKFLDETHKGTLHAIIRECYKKMSTSSPPLYCLSYLLSKNFDPIDIMIAVPKLIPVINRSIARNDDIKIYFIRHLANIGLNYYDSSYDSTFVIHQEKKENGSDINSIIKKFNPKHSDCRVCARISRTGIYEPHQESILYNESVLFYLLCSYSMEEIELAYPELKVFNEGAQDIRRIIRESYDRIKSTTRSPSEHLIRVFDNQYNPINIIVAIPELMPSIRETLKNKKIENHVYYCYLYRHDRNLNISTIGGYYDSGFCPHDAQSRPAPSQPHHSQSHHSQQSPDPSPSSPDDQKALLEEILNEYLNKYGHLEPFDMEERARDVFDKICWNYTYDHNLLLEYVKDTLNNIFINC